jgi:DNA-binding protein YbaB
VKVTRPQADLSRESLAHRVELLESRSQSTGVQPARNEEVLEITIDPKAIDPDDPEPLADMVLAAVNQALSSARGLMESKMSGPIPGDLSGLGLPGL